MACVLSVEIISRVKGGVNGGHAKEKAIFVINKNVSHEKDECRC